ncbi:MULTISPECIES: tetratricopeptide repeat protein [Burkholderia]|uniref:Putative TPR repeat protein n=1 Tax=Burkholderia paludis TaxID=1506587 RepID=A0A6P2PEF6_9BURK|nr:MULTISPECIES: tetratricopeptide repeat-containing glycosyltransferase family protein [Burkholderia]CAB3760013.1 Lipopolysaccharide assembly protein B [Burkholderia paludis]VWC06355.1 putative TPR repeat protein [Burkholderia paludis]
MPPEQPIFATALDAHLANRLNEAERGYRATLELDPHHVDALHLLGVILATRGAWIEAEALLRRAIALHEDANYLANLGNLLLKRGRVLEAEVVCRRAVEVGPGCTSAHLNLAETLAALAQVEEAEGRYRRVIELDPRSLTARNNLATLLMDQRRFDEAARVYRDVLEIDGTYVHTLYNFGLMLLRSVQLTEAETMFRRALAVQPDHRDAVHNLGTTFRLAGRYDEAEVAYRQALALAPDWADAQWNLGTLLLSQGRLAEGWPLAEARYSPQREPQDLPPPADTQQWRGESLEGKTLVVWYEQGYGDCVQFVRYVPLLRTRGVRKLTILCPEALKPLVATVNGVDDVKTRSDHVEPHDYWVYPLSLPLLFGTTLDTIPAALPYLHALPERIEHWRARIETSAGLKIGLVWKGFADNQHDATRSVPSLAPLAPLWSVPGATYFSLQKGQGEDEAASPPAGQPVVDLGSSIRDFADTAAIIAQLDLLISVDTAAAHVAGAIGKPCWLMLPCDWTDWRWLLERSDSPWYPGVMRLFRQAREDQDWSGVAQLMADMLRGWSV